MSPDLPFVIEPPGDAAAVDRAAASAAATWKLRPVHRIRLGMNGIYAAGDDVIVRVGRTTAPPSAAGHLVEVLAAHGVRAPRLLREPVEVDGLGVFAIERLVESGPVDWRDVGEQVARVHAIDPGLLPTAYPLPWCGSFPWWRVEDIFADIADLLDAPARAGLEDVINVSLPAFRARLGGPDVVCHGDVHPGNVIQTAAGAVLIDWDLLCHGPVAWDHAAMLTWAERWGGEWGTYDRFAEGYGRSLRGDIFAEGQAALRLAIATVMRLRAGRTNPAAAEEAQRRLRFWRDEPGAPVWTAQ